MKKLSLGKISVLLLISLFLILSACKTDEGEATPSPSDTEPPVTEAPATDEPTTSPTDTTTSPSPSAERDKTMAIVQDNVIEKEYTIERADEDIVGHLYIAVPEISHEEYAESAEMLNEYFDSLKEKYREGFESELDELADEELYGFGARRSMELSFITKYNKDGIVSFYITVASYQGGAHGSIAIMSETFDLKEGTRITADTLFIADEQTYTTRIKDYILAEMDERAQDDHSPYYENYPELLEATYNKENFVLTEDGLRVYFQVYDLAPYAGGSIQFDIPYSEIADILNPENIDLD
jgi:hypothetical protein